MNCIVCGEPVGDHCQHYGQLCSQECHVERDMAEPEHPYPWGDDAPRAANDEVRND